MLVLPLVLVLATGAGAGCWYWCWLLVLVLVLAAGAGAGAGAGCWRWRWCWLLVLVLVLAAGAAAVWWELAGTSSRPHLLCLPPHLPQQIYGSLPDWQLAWVVKFQPHFMLFCGQLWKYFMPCQCNGIPGLFSRIPGGLSKQISKPYHTEGIDFGEIGGRRRVSGEVHCESLLVPVPVLAYGTGLHLL